MNLEDAKTLLADYANELEIEEAFGYILIKFKEFVPKDRWDIVHSLIREAGGSYQAGMGKDSHWRLAKDESSEPTTPAPPTKPVGKLTQTQLVEEAMSLLEQSMATSEKAWQKLKEAYKKA